MGLFEQSGELCGWVCLDKVESYAGGFVWTKWRAMWVGLFGLSGGLCGWVCLD